MDRNASHADVYAAIDRPVCVCCGIPTSSWRSPNVGLILGQRRRRWSNIKPTMGQSILRVVDYWPLDWPPHHSQAVHVWHLHHRTALLMETRWPRRPIGLSYHGDTLCMVVPRTYQWSSICIERHPPHNITRQRLHTDFEPLSASITTYFVRKLKARSRSAQESTLDVRIWRLQKSDSDV